MTPRELLDYYDSGHLWPAAPSSSLTFDLRAAYADALAVRALRIARGEKPRGFKVGFTNRSIWQRYGVFAPIWGAVYDSTVTFCDGNGKVFLGSACQPRLEPEAVFGIRSTPAANATLQDLFDSIEWVAPGFEVVQSHLQDWKFKAEDTVADGGLHSQLIVGTRVPVRAIAANAVELDTVLAGAVVSLHKGEVLVEQGRGANVLDSPLLALYHFLNELRQCPGAPDLTNGDLITTGTWTDAWPIRRGETWRAEFGMPLSTLGVAFE